MNDDLVRRLATEAGFYLDLDERWRHQDNGPGFGISQEAMLRFAELVADECEKESLKQSRM